MFHVDINESKKLVRGRVVKMDWNSRANSIHYGLG